jgi:hypothetical protein
MTSTEQHERMIAIREKNHPQWYHGIVRRCCVCKRVNVRGKWIYMPKQRLENGDVKYSDGYCPKDYKKEREKLLTLILKG